MEFTNNCGDTCSVLIPISVSRQDEHKDDRSGSVRHQTNDLQIYPNPAQERFYVQSVSALDNISIYNTMGRNIHKIEDLPDSGSKLIKVTALSPGIYMVVMKLKNGDVVCKKVIIQ